MDRQTVGRTGRHTSSAVVNTRCSKMLAAAVLCSELEDSLESTLARRSKQEDRSTCCMLVSNILSN